MIRPFSTERGMEFTFTTPDEVVRSAAGMAVRSAAGIDENSGMTGAEKESGNASLDGTDEPPGSSLTDWNFIRRGEPGAAVCVPVGAVVCVPVRGAAWVLEGVAVCVPAGAAVGVPVRDAAGVLAGAAVGVPAGAAAGIVGSESMESRESSERSWKSSAANTEATEKSSIKREVKVRFMCTSVLNLFESFEA